MRMEYKTAHICKEKRDGKARLAGVNISYPVFGTGGRADRFYSKLAENCLAYAEKVLAPAASGIIAGGGICRRGYTYFLSFRAEPAGDTVRVILTVTLTLENKKIFRTEYEQIWSIADERLIKASKKSNTLQKHTRRVVK